MGGRGRESNRDHLDEGNHGKHVVGHNNYVKEKRRSIITISKERLQGLLMNTEEPGKKETIESIM